MNLKGSVGTPTRLHSLFFGTALYNDPHMAINLSLFKFSKDQKAQFRMEVLEFHKKWGTKATFDAYRISKPTVYRWKQRLTLSLGRLDSLIPLSTAPKTKRTMKVDPKITDFISSLRTQYGHLGKEKIKPLLDEFCKTEGQGLTSVSISTIGRIIKRRSLTLTTKRTYHNPSTKWGHRKLHYKQKVKHSPKQLDPGYLEIDTLTQFVSGLRVFVFNAVDIRIKFQFSYAYTSLSSLSALNFFKKLESVYPINSGIKFIQTDNGLEFQGAFHRYLMEKELNHLFIYPRCPKINGFVERANRTLREEFLDLHLDSLALNLTGLNRELMDYLVWYNTRRVHKSLGNISPINYLLKISPESQKYWTHTINCIC